MIAGTHPWLRYFATLLFCGGLYIGFVSSQQPDDLKKGPPPKIWQLPSVLEKNRSPASVEELREIEKHVQKVLEKVMPAVVGVRVGPGQGSGVIVRPDGTILTAGHVSGTPDKDAKVVLVLPKQILNAKTLGKNNPIDSGMMKISKAGTYPFVEMGKSADLKVGQWVIAIGHPGGFRDNRTPVVRVGRILFLHPSVIRTDCTLVGGDSGGPLFDMQGRVIGIHSRIGGSAISENMHVPVDTFRDTWNKLAAGDSWGGPIGSAATVRALGGRVVFEKKDTITKNDPTEVCPDPMYPTEKSHRKIYTVKMRKGATYTLDLISTEKIGKKLDKDLFDPYLRVENPAGKEIAQDDDGGGLRNSRIVLKADADGDYRVIATSFGAGQTGPFHLVIREADYRGGKVDVWHALKLPVPMVAKLVADTAKAKIHLEINAQILDEKGLPLAGKEFNLIWDQGKAAAKTDSEGFAHWPLKADQRKPRLELPPGARAAFTLTDDLGTDLSLALSLDDKTVETVKSAGGKIVKTFDGAIAKTDPFDSERDKCYRHVHEFKMSAGKTYTLDMVSEEFDTFLRVEDNAKDKILAQDDDGGGNLNARIVFTPKDDGTYRIVATTCDPGDFGAYRLTIRETNAKPAPKKDDKK